ncbi:MAG: hypothetical protein WAR37_00220 [Candidatus Microsaccharimonas sp.]
MGESEEKGNEKNPERDIQFFLAAALTGFLILVLAFMVITTSYRWPLTWIFNPQATAAELGRDESWLALAHLGFTRFGAFLLLIIAVLLLSLICVKMWRKWRKKS